METKVLKKGIEGLPTEILEAIEKQGEHRRAKDLVRKLEEGWAEILDKDPDRSIVLLKTDEKHFLFGLDTNGTEPFVSEVEGKPKSVRDAFDSITPFLVRLTRKVFFWERHGEVWFLRLPFKRRGYVPTYQRLESSLHRADFSRDLCGRPLKKGVDKCINAVGRGGLATLLLGILAGWSVAVSSFFFYFFLAQYLFGAAGAFSTTFLLLSVVWVASSILLLLWRGIPPWCKLFGITILPTAFPFTLVIAGSYHLSQSVLASGKITNPHHADLDLGPYWHLVQFNKDPD